MTFLSMAPWLAWSLLGLTAAAITIIFFLRIQHRQVLVSSSLLWDRVLEKRKKRSWLEILRRLLSLLIALLIGLSLAMVLTGAERGGDGDSARDVRIVVDNSVSMAARRSDGRTRLQAANDLAAELLGRGSAADTFTLVDRTGRVLSPATRDRDVVGEALAELAPTAEPRSLPRFEEGVETWLITDGVGLSRVPEGIRVLSVFEPATNAGVSAFEIRATPLDPFRYEAFLEVANFSPAPASVQVELRDDRGVQFRRTVQLEPDGLYRNTFDLEPLQGGALTARTSVDGDALDLDDAAWAWLPRTREVRLIRVAAGDSPLDELLEAEPHVELTRMSPEEYGEWLAAQSSGGGGAAALTDPVPADGLVFVGWAPPEAPPLPALLIAPQPVSWLPAIDGRVEEPDAPDLFVDDPLLEFVDLHDLRMGSALRVEPGGARVLVATGELPLMLAGGERQPWVMTAFSLEESDFAQSLGFPIFVSNLVEWVRNEPPLIRVEPGRVSVPLPGARITDAEGNALAVRDLGDRVVFRPPSPGLYFARSLHRTVPVAVVAGSRVASDINASALTAAEGQLDDLPPHRVLWPALLLLAAGLLVVEGLTYHRRITV